MSNNEAFAASDAFGMRTGWRHYAAVALALFVTIAVVFGVAVAGPLAGEAQAQDAEVECRIVKEVERRELTIDAIVTGNQKNLKRFAFLGLKPGEKIAGFEVRNTRPKKTFNSNEGNLVVHKNTRELSDLVSLQSGGYFYEYEQFSGALSDGDSRLTISFNDAKTVASPMGTGKSGRVELNLPNTDTDTNNYKAVAFVLTERKECTTKPVPPPSETSAAPSEPSPPSDTSETVTPDPSPSTEKTTSPTTAQTTLTTTSAPQPLPTTTTAGSTTSEPTSVVTPIPTIDPNAGAGDQPGDATKPRENWIGIQIYARAFDKPWEHAPDKLQLQYSPRTNDTRYSTGIRFRLYRSDGTRPFEASDMGPSTPINEPWATCVTNEQGACTIYPPTRVLDTGYFIIVQETQHPGSYHVPEINWGTYGNFNNRTGAQLPGFVNLKQRYDLVGAVIPMSYANGTSDITSGKILNSFGSSVQSLNNPPLEKVRRCQSSDGPKIALVMDTTASISAAKGEELYRDAVYRKTGNLLDSLQGTGASVAFFSFSSDSPSNRPNYPQPISIDQNLQDARDAAKSALRGMGGVTNWERGLDAAKNSGYNYDEIIFVTDGDANHWGSANMGVNHDGSVRGVEAAIFRANEIKASGTRIVSIGVGQAETASHWKGAGQMKAVSGPTYGEDYFGTDWDHLASTLRAAASQVLCQLEVEVDKAIVDAAGNRLADQSEANGWDMSLAVSNIRSNVDGYLAGGIETTSPVYPAQVSGQSGVLRPNGGRIATSEKTPNSSWMVTFYGDNGVDARGNRIPNSATLGISEDTGSKQGYEFVPGSVTQGNYRGSWYEVIDIATDKTVQTGVLSGPQINLGNQPQGRRVKVHMVNRVVPEIVLRKDLPNGRSKQADQFTLSIAKVTGAQNGAYVAQQLGESVTTQGTEKGLQKTIDRKTLQAGPAKLEPNMRYLLREEAAGDTKLSEYDTTLKCDGANATLVPDSRRPGSGAVWEITTGASVSKNITCTFTNTPVLKSSITWKKVDNEDKPLACSQWMLTRTKDENGNEVKDQQWAVNDNAPDCTYDNTGLAQKEEMNAEAGSFKVADLPLGTYVIEEVRAPNGYGVNNQRKSETIVLRAADASAGVTVGDPFVNYPDVTTPGTLPRTGGVGIGTVAGLAGVIVALGCVMLRRRSV